MNRVLVNIFSMLMLCVVAVSASAQSVAYESIIKKLQAECKTQTFTFSKEAFALLTYFDLNMKEEMKTLMDDVDQMKVVIASDKNDNGFVDRACAIMAESGLNQVDISNYTNLGKSSVYVEGKLFISEAHIVVDYGQGALVSFFGNFKTKDIKRLMKGANTIGWSTIGK